jgi:hypothetical protein
MIKHIAILFFMVFVSCQSPHHILPRNPGLDLHEPWTRVATSDSAIDVIGSPFTACFVLRSGGLSCVGTLLSWRSGGCGDHSRPFELFSTGTSRTARYVVAQSLASTPVGECGFTVCRLQQGATNYLCMGSFSETVGNEQSSSHRRTCLAEFEFDGGVSDLRLGHLFFCGARHGSIFCQFDGYQQQVTFPEEEGGVRIVQFEVAQGMGCGVDDKHRVWCWGRGPGRPFPVGNHYVEPHIARMVQGIQHATRVTVGASTSCVTIDASSELLCWGNTPWADGLFHEGLHRVVLPEMARSVSWNSECFCALLTSGMVTCSGLCRGTMEHPLAEFVTQTSLGAVKSLALSESFACAVKIDGTPVCSRGFRCDRPMRNDDGAHIGSDTTQQRWPAGALTPALRNVP